MISSYAVDQTRWGELSIFDQMGNIYSEVGRSFKARQNNDVSGCEAATSRAIDLFDATTKALIARKSPKVKEVLRAKEEYLNSLYGASSHRESIQGLDRYFSQFAIAARLNR